MDTGKEGWQRGRKGKSGGCKSVPSGTKRFSGARLSPKWTCQEIFPTPIFASKRMYDSRNSLLGFRPLMKSCMLSAPPSSELVLFWVLNGVAFAMRHGGRRKGWQRSVTLGRVGFILRGRRPLTGITPFHSWSTYAVCWDKWCRHVLQVGKCPLGSGASPS